MSLTASKHSVRFFDSLESRISTIADFVQEGLANGATVLSVATRHTWTGVEAVLRGRSVPVDNHAAAEQLLMLDAHKQLERFMSKDVPDPVRLEATLGAMVQELSAGPRPLRIYGEMVDVLAERGLHIAAQRLEQLWNSLAARTQFELFCGYTAGHFGNERTAPTLQAICAEHSHVHCHDEDVLGKFLLSRAYLAAPDISQS
jgi:hypothetical protein